MDEPAPESLASARPAVTRIARVSACNYWELSSDYAQLSDGLVSYAGWVAARFRSRPAVVARGQTDRRRGQRDNGASGGPAQNGLRARLWWLAPRVEHDNRLAAGTDETLLLEHLEHASSHLAGTPDKP
jgi:hypothetical protein